MQTPTDEWEKCKNSYFIGKMRFGGERGIRTPEAPEQVFTLHYHSLPTSCTLLHVSERLYLHTVAHSVNTVPHGMEIQKARIGALVDRLAPERQAVSQKHRI